MAQSKIRIKREPFFLNVEGWRNGVNLNDFTNTGAFALSTNLTNAPNGWTWVILFVIGVRYDTIEQMIFSLSGVQRREYRSGAWSSWKSMGGVTKGLQLRASCTGKRHEERDPTGYPEWNLHSVHRGTRWRTDCHQERKQCRYLYQASSSWIFRRKRESRYFHCLPASNICSILDKRSYKLRSKSHARWSGDTQDSKLGRRASAIHESIYSCIDVASMRGCAA